MKKLLLIPIFCLSVSAFAQQKKAVSKLDAQLKMWVNDPQLLLKEQPALAKNGSVLQLMVPVIFKSTAGNKQALVSRYGGTLNSVMGTICTAEIPLSAMEAFASQDAILKIESSQPVEIYNDKAKQLVRADSVQNGFLPNGQSYTGKGVVVGVVDTGIDFLNADFKQKNDSNKTRIVAIWDQTDNSGTKPQGYSYGSAWNATQIQAALTDTSIITQKDFSGHGTHTSGSAAGLRGMAYDAEIIHVKTPLVSNGDYKFSTSAKTLDAVNYIYELAGDMGKSCVINMSLGFNFGAPHDGTSLFEQGLDWMMENRRGFVVCASAGNEGQDYSHHGDYALTPDSVWTYINGLNGCTWYGANNSSVDDSLFISVVMDSARVSFSGGGITFQQKLFQTPWVSISDLKATVGGMMFPVIYGNGDTAATISITGATYDSTRSEWYVLTRDNFLLSASGTKNLNLFKIAFKGSGKFNAWIQALNSLGVNAQTYGGKVDARFKASDNKNVIGIPGTGKNVLTVGAYINKKNYVNIFGQTQSGLNTNGTAAGARALFSSNGPTTDGRIKPDFCAPGLNVASTKSRYSERDSSEMTDGNTIVYSGTSMSCPIAAGAIALLLEKYKWANYAEIRSAITATAIKDNFTTSNLPNNIWGVGKLNIFAAMKLTVTGIEEQTNPVKIDANGVSVYPNPANNQLTIELPQSVLAQKLSVVDITGRECYQSVNALNSYQLDVSQWKSGMYFYTIQTNGKTVSGKFLIVR
jgi:subtilisin family serine protease